MIPSEIRSLMKKIEENGFQIYAVGGYVRDHLLNIQNNDYDLCTNCDLNEIKKLYPELVIMKENSNRNTGVLRINNVDVEISTFKSDNLEEDLKKRDFTIDSIVMDSNGSIKDYLNGIDDLKNKVIRLCDESGKGLVADPLRILRAIRIASIYNFDISPSLKEKMLENKELLKSVSVERILRELSLILLSDKPGKYLREYREIFAIIIPSLEKTFDFNQNNPYHIYDVFEHTLRVVDNTEKNIILRYAALFHDIGKPENYTVDSNGKGHFYNHAYTSSKIFNDFARQYKMDNKTRERINKLIMCHDYELSVKEIKMKNYIIMLGIENVELMFKLKAADILAQNPEYIYRLEALKETAEIYQRLISSKPCLSTKDLELNGYDLVGMGYRGNEIGKKLNEIFSLVLKEQLQNNREKLLDFAYQSKEENEIIRL